MNIEGIAGKITLDVSQALTAVDSLEAKLNKLGNSKANDMSGIQSQIDNLTKRLIASQKKLEKEMTSIYDNISKKQKAYIEQATRKEKSYTEAIKQEAKKRQDALAKQAIQVTTKGQDKSEQALNERIIQEQRKYLAKRLADYKSFGHKVTEIMKGIIWAPIFINNAVFMFQGVFNSLGRLWDSTIGQVIKVNSQIEDYITRLKVSTGTLMAAKIIWGDVTKYATESVYGFEESVQAATALLPILRGGREELKTWLPIIGDIAAGFGLSYQEATTGLIRSYSSGIASSELFREKGVSAALGFTPGKHYSGKESAKQIQEEWESVNSVFRGAAGELSKNWTGILNKLSDQFFLFVRDVGEADLFKNIKFALQFALDKFEQLRNSGDGYKKLVNVIANTLKAVFDRTVRIFKALFTGIKEMWIIGDLISDAMKSDQQKAVEAKIFTLEQRRSDLQTSMFTKGADATKGKVESINNELTQLYEIQKRLDDPFRGLGQYLDDSIAEWDKVTSYIDANNKALEYNKELATDPHILASDGMKDLKRDSDRRAALLKKQNDQIASLTKDALDKVRDVIDKARLDSIRFSKGEWSAFVEETAIEARKLGEKVSKEIEQAGGEGTLNGSKVQASYFKAQLESKIKEYENDLLELQRKANTDLASIGMSQAETERFNIQEAYQDYKWVGLPKQLQDQVDLTKQMQLLVVEATKAIQDQSLALQHQGQIVQSSIPSWNSYGKSLAQIQTEFKANSFGQSKERTGELEVIRTRAIEVLDSTTVQQYKEQIADMRHEFNSLSLSNKEIELANFNRELARLVSPEFKAKFPELAEEMQQVFKMKFEGSQINTYQDGIKAALLTVRNEFKTTGENIKTLLEDVFSGLSSSLEDGFFNVMTGNIKDAEKMFQSFADSVLKSIAQIMAQKTAQNIFTGLTGLMAGVFHSGGVVGEGGTQRMVNPLMFAGAPKYHTGGIAGLAPGDVPSILKAGELVLPKGSWGVGNASKPQKVEIINQTGQNLKITKSQTTSDIQGEVLSLWIDAVNRNRMGVRDLIGARG